MGIALIITRQPDADDEAPSLRIRRDEWSAVVADDPDLSFRRDPHEAINPRTGEKLSMAPGELEAQLTTPDGVVAFLSYREGDLCMRYDQSMESAADPVRQKVSDVARRLGCKITHDAGDETLDW